MSAADIRNWKKLRGQLVEVRWRDPIDDWPYFIVREVDASKEMIELQGADYPDGSAKHDGDVFWVMADKIKSATRYDYGDF